MKPQWPVISENWHYLTSIGRLDIHRFNRLSHRCWFVVVWGKVETYADGAIKGSGNCFCGLGWEADQKFEIGAYDKWDTELTDEERAAVMVLVKMERSLA